MLRNYFVIAVRNLIKHKYTSLINVLGLSVGIACCILALMYVKYEFSYDDFQKNRNNIYRVVQCSKKYGNDGSTPTALAPNMRMSFEELNKSVRLMHKNKCEIKYGDKQFIEKGICGTDKEIFDVFTIDLIAGDVKTCLDAPEGIVINEELAEKYFGAENPLGKVFTVDKKLRRVTAVMKNIPSNSTLRARALVPAASENSVYSNFDTNWGNNFAETYIFLKPGVSAANLEKKINEKYKNEVYYYVGADITFKFQPFNRIHLYSSKDFGFADEGDIDKVLIYSAIAFLVLLIACVNFINISIGRLSSRFKEIGVRKILGANKRQVVFQFWGEIILLCSIAVIIGLAVSTAFLTEFNQIINRKITAVVNWDTPGTLLTVFFVTCIIAGAVPALMFSKYNPAEILRGKTKIGGSNNLTKILIVFQFSLTLFFLIVAGLMANQVDFIMDKLRVPKNDKILDVNTRSIMKSKTDFAELRQKVNLLKNELKGSQLISCITENKNISDRAIFEYEGRKWKQITQGITETYLDVWGIKIKEGRNIDPSKYTSDSTSAILINETFARQNNISSPLNKIIKVANKDYHIVGVVKDYTPWRLDTKIEPMAFKYEHDYGGSLIVRTAGKNVSEVLSLIKRKQQELFPGTLFSYTFYDETVAKEYRAEINTRQLLTYISILAVIISAFGILGLATFTIEKRTKEIGIRKVLGATVADILRLLAKEYIYMTLISALIASPFAYYYIKHWLDNYVYHIEITVWAFVAAATFILLVSFLMIGYKAVKASLANPVESLKYE